MNEYNKGDLVEATNEYGDKITARLGKREDGGLYLGCYNWSFPDWIVQNAGFSTIKVIEKAAPALPTEPGFYADFEGELWRLAGVEGSYEWSYLDGVEFSPYSGQPVDYAPFTRLEPVADTAKKVLDFVLEQNRYADDFWERIQEFGNQLGVKND